LPRLPALWLEQVLVIMSDELEPLAPEAAVDLYLEQRRDEVSNETLRCHRSRLGKFVDWCEENGIMNMNDVTGRDLHAYRVDRREQDDLKAVTLQGQLSTLRVFLGFCASVEAVPEGLRSKVMLPTVKGGDEVSKTTLDANRAEEALEYLERYKYAGRQHVIFLLLWRTGMRKGALRALDVDDCDLDTDEPAVEVVHRPETDTPLKNGTNGERWVALSHEVATVVQDYIENPDRPNVRDEYGRQSLITTNRGRASRTLVQGEVYRVTRPCIYGDECPHDRDLDDCKALEHGRESTCPSSRSPHDVRSGAITAHLLDDVPSEIVSDRMNVSKNVLDKHYDRRSEREKAEQRRDYL